MWSGSVDFGSLGVSSAGAAGEVESTTAATTGSSGTVAGPPPSAMVVPRTAATARLPTTAPVLVAAPSESAPAIAGAATAVPPATASTACGIAGISSAAIADDGWASWESRVPPAIPPSSSGSMTIARWEPTSSTSSETIVHLAQSSR